MKVAVVEPCQKQKAYDYSRHFPFPFDVQYLCDTYVKKVYKKDITLDVDWLKETYDLIIPVGADCLKALTGLTGITNLQGAVVADKFIPIINPAMLYFKPEGKDAFNNAVNRIVQYVKNNKTLEDLPTLLGISEEKEAEEYLNKVFQKEKTVVALDSETSSLYPREGYILGISISADDSEGAYILSDCLTETCEELLQKIIDKHEIVFHNAKFDVKWFRYHLNLKIDDFHDTMLQHYVLDENNPHGLKPLSVRYTTLGAYDEEQNLWIKTFCKQNNINKSDFSFELIPFDIIYKYAALDAVATRRIHNVFWPVLKKNAKLKGVYENLLIRGTKFLIDIEEFGCPVSAERLEYAKSRLNRRLKKYNDLLYTFKEVKKLEEELKTKFNPNSVVHLRHLFFDYLKLPRTGILTDKGEHSTNAEALEILSKHHVIPKVILKIRKTTKILSTYVNKMLNGMDLDNKLRTGFNLHVTTSGRLSSSGKLNLQQLPRDDKFVKWSILAPKGYKIVSVDLGTAEMYYVAVLSKDKNLQKIFKSGGDFHTETALGVFNIKVPKSFEGSNREYLEKYHPQLRQVSKAISFGILYGSGPEKVASMSGCSVSEAKAYIKKYHEQFKELSEWLDFNKAKIMKNQFIYSFFGRKRRVPNVRSVDKGTASHEVRSAINFLVQSVASDSNLLGAMDAHDLLKEKGLDAHIFALVHDSVIALVKDEHVSEFVDILKNCMQKDRGLNIKDCPISCDFNVGQDYKEAA